MNNDIGYSSYQDPRLQPPEYDEGEERGSEEIEIEIHLDANIVIDSEGNWEYEDTNYPWARNTDNRYGDWYTESGVYISDPVSIVEKVDDLLLKEDVDKSVPGRYNVSGYVYLYYEVTGVRSYYTDRGTWYEEEYIDTEYADASFNKSDSHIVDFEIKSLN